ncbi:MAG: SGNH/GDSL hydrolase family protein [Pseudomonadota bacterium]
MTKRWIGLLPCATLVVTLAVSCGNSDNDGNGAHGGAGGVAGTSGSAEGGGHAGAGIAGAPGDAGAAGSPGNSGAGASSAGEGGSAGADGSAGGEGGSAGAPDDTSPLSPAAIPDLAFWLDGNAMSFSDFDENFPNPSDSGRVRSIPEALPLTGHWQAPTSAERPIRELGALRFRPVDTSTGYYLKDTAGTLWTDDSTLAISFRLLNSNTAQGALTAPIGSSSQSAGIFFVGDSIGIYYNHTQVTLKKHMTRGLHGTMVVRFTPTRVDVQYDINGLRTSETIETETPILHETTSNWLLGYDAKLNSGMYGFVSQVVGVNRAVSDTETDRLLTWLAAQPIPEAFPVTQPLVAIVGDSIANGDQVPGWQTWSFTMLADLAQTHPDVQLLNNASNGAGIPKVKNSDYTEAVLPWYSAMREKNILIVAAGTNDIAGGGDVQDVLDRYYGLLDAARATGWKTVACTVLPRSDLGTGSPLAKLQADRLTFNADVVQNYASHADALADVAAISAMGDSNNTTYYSDKIHPTAVGHALLEPVYRAAVAGLL